MKTLSRLLFCTLLCSLLTSSAVFGQQIKIASVDMSKIFSEYYKTKKAESELKERAAGYEKEMKDRSGELQSLGESAKKLLEEAQSPALSDDKKTEKQKAFESKKMDYRILEQQLTDMVQSRKKELDDQKTRMRLAIVDEITKVIQEKAKRDGISMVVDKTGLTLSGVPPFIFVQDSMDITGDIVKMLNANAPAGTAAAPAASDKTKDAPKDSKK